MTVACILPQCTEPHGIAKSHYDATADDELSFMVGIGCQDIHSDHLYYRVYMYM